MQARAGTFYNSMYYTKALQTGKYGNIKSMYKGQGYDSKAEIEQAMILDSQLRAGEIKAWEKQKTLELRVNDYLICTYRIDFIVYHNDGITEYLEVKGFPTDTWRLKWKLFEALYGDDPQVKLTIAWTGKQFKMRKKKK